MQHLLATMLIIGILIASAAARLQSVAAKGILYCNQDTAGLIKIELWDEDSIDPDDFMGVTMSEENGKFSIQGKESEFTKIDPQLRILHKCGNPKAQCYKQTTIKIPQEYVTNAKKPESLYDFKEIDLSREISKETSICDDIKI